MADFFPIHYVVTESNYELTTRQVTHQVRVKPEARDLSPEQKQQVKDAAIMEAGHLSLPAYRTLKKELICPSTVKLWLDGLDAAYEFDVPFYIGAVYPLNENGTINEAEYKGPIRGERT